MFVFILFFVLTASSFSRFEEFKLHFGRVYSSSEEEKQRETIFYDNLRNVDLMKKDGHIWAGVTQFSDLADQEFRQRYGMKVQKFGTNFRVPSGTNLRNFNDVPKSVDWTTRGVVTPVKNQGQCGSCWVFSATGALESAFSILNNLTAVAISEEEYLACYGPNYSVCNGGSPEQAFLWAKNRALCTEASYPYVPPTGIPYPPPPKLICEESKCSDPSAVGIPAGTIVDVFRVPPKYEAQLMRAVAVGPVSVSVVAGPLQLYHSGIMSGQCMNYQGDHAMLVVGYGTENGVDYWKLKNSYGPKFGEDGYMRVKRNDTVCDGRGGIGILSDPIYPLLKKLKTGEH